MERVGGHPVLDFINTVDSWQKVPRRDYLETCDDVAQFAVDSGLAARNEVRCTGPELQRLHSLRILLYGMFSAVAAGGRPRAGGLEILQSSWAEAAPNLRLRATKEGRYELAFNLAGCGPALLRYRLLQSAIELLTSDLLPRIGACPSCGWLFLDVSKNRSRRWCSMQMCGGEAKARTYYRRKHLVSS